MRLLNTTGSFYIDNYGDYYSYSTQLTGSYLGEYWYNNTYYSQTTRCHQGNVPNEYKEFYHTLNYCGFGQQNWKQCIQNEIEYIKRELNIRFNKRKTQKNKETIEELLQKQLFLQSVLEREAEYVQ